MVWFLTIIFLLPASLSQKHPWVVSAPRVLVFSRTSVWCRSATLQYHPNTKRKMDQRADSTQPQAKVQFDYLHKVPY